MHKPLQVQVSDVHPLFLLIPEQPAPATGRHPFQKPMGLCSDTLGHLELSLLHFRALQQDTELNKTTKPTTQSKLSAVGHSILLSGFLQILFCGHSSAFTSLTPPCPDFSPLLLPAVKPSLLCLEDFDSWKSQKALIKLPIVQLFPSLSCIWSLRSLNSSLRKCSVWKEAREGLESTSQALPCPVLHGWR